MNDSGVVADLHVHTTASDGTLTPSEVIETARRVGLRGVAITDHERMHPSLEVPVQEEGGLTVIRGIELKVEGPAGSHVDILGYGIRRTPALEGVIRRVQTNRIERARHMRRLVEEELGIRLDVDMAAGVGRPHIARAIAAHEDTDMNVDDAFDELIGDGRSCHVTRSVPQYRDVIDDFADAAAFLSVAHPLRYDDVAGAIEIAIELGAVELWYPYDEPVDVRPVREAVHAHDLHVTGGSDAHGADIGLSGIGSSDFERIRAVVSID